MFFGLGAAVFGLIGKLRARRKSFPRRKYRCLLFCSCLACITLVRSRRLRGVGHGKVGGIIGTVVSWPTLGRVGQPLEFERINEIRVEIQSIGDSDLKQAFGTLLNLVEHLAEENQGLGDEHQRLRDEIARLKGESKLPPAPRRKANKDICSEKERNKHEPKPSQNQVPRGTFKDLQVHQEQICPICNRPSINRSTTRRPPSKVSWGQSANSQ